MAYPTRQKLYFTDPNQQQIQQPVNCVRFNYNGQYFMSGGKDRIVRLWNTATGQLVKSYSAGGHSWEVLSVCIAGDNSRFASGGGDRAVFLWDVMTGRVLRRFQGHFQRVNAVAFNEDASVLISGSYDATCKIWDCRSNMRTPIQTLGEGKDSISSVQMSDHEILTTSIDGAIRIYDIRRGALTTDQMNHACTHGQFSHDGNCILLSSMDSCVRLIEKQSGELLNHYTGHLNKQYRVESTLSYDDTFVFSGSEDGTVFVWDLLEGECVKELRSHSKAVISLSYHPTEHQLLTASSDGKIILWE